MASLIFAKNSVFIPECFDNMANPEAEQIRIIWRVPTAQEKEQIFPMTPVQLENGETTFGVKIDRVKLLKSCLVKVENLIVGEKQIRTAEDLLSTPGLSTLFEEFLSHIYGKLNNPVFEKKTSN